MLTACVALLAAAGCSGDAKSQPPEFTPTGHIETPSETPSNEAPTEPALPDAATQPTEDGARAFITYHWDLINYAQVTGDVKSLRQASGPHCDGCNGGISSVRDVYRSGGHVTAGNYVETITKVAPYVPEPGVVAFEIDAQVTNDAHESVGADGTTSQFQADTTNYKIYVLWTDRGWRLDVMEVQ